MKITLAILKAFDPEPTTRGADTFYNCPTEACSDKPRDRAHQKLGVNLDKGVYHCFVCGARGSLAAAKKPRKQIRDLL